MRDGLVRADAEREVATLFPHQSVTKRRGDDVVPAYRAHDRARERCYDTTNVHQSVQATREDDAPKPALFVL